MQHYSFHSGVHGFEQGKPCVRSAFDVALPIRESVLRTLYAAKKNIFGGTIGLYCSEQSADIVGVDKSDRGRADLVVC